MRILISRPDKIGDVVLALHGAKQLKMLRPDFEIYFHASAYTRKILENITFVSGVVEMGEDLAPYSFDAAVDLMAKSDTAALYARSNIPLRIGNSARWFAFRYNKTKYIRRSRALLNEAEYNWQLLSLLDKRFKYTPLTATLDESDFKQIDTFADSKDYCVLMPGVSVSALAWPVDCWLSLAKALAESGEEVIVILGPAEEAQRKQFQSLEGLSGVRVATFPEFSSLLGVLREAKYYVGPSTGITHLAAAVGAEGLALYPEIQSMHPRRWLPFKSSLKALSLSKQVTWEAVFDSLKSEYREDYDPMPRQKVSAFVVCCNEEKNIRRCLESIAWADEIVVVDSGSTDATLDIVAEYTDKIFHRAWTGHSEQKQFALEQCRFDWILNIDSDEEVSMELKAALLQILSNPKERSQAEGYAVCRMVHFLDRWWDRGGWFPEYRLRFFKRRGASWGGVNPHEKALVSGRIRKLHDPIYHFTYKDFSHQIDTLNKHSSLSAQCLYREGKRCYLINILLNPPFRFFKFYIIKMGFREGVPGLIVAGLEASYTLFKYVKLWELQRAGSRTKTKVETAKVDLQSAA